MSQVTAELVEIVRDFMAAHRIIERVARRYRDGELRFEELHELVGDDDGSVLYRLKERSHSLFRPRDAESALASSEEALFDLAVGSLFHEAMKFRENFYQHEIYGPRMRSLRTGAPRTSEGLFREFAKILDSVSDRLQEGLQETEELTQQTREQLRALLVEHAGNGFVARFLVENRAGIEPVFGCDLDALFEAIAGSAAAGFELAGRCYLDSGFYREADAVLSEADARTGLSSDLARLAVYARGMAAYLAADYASCVALLAAWYDEADSGDAARAENAQAAVSRIGNLAEGPDRAAVAAAAARLADRIAASASAA